MSFQERCWKKLYNELFVEYFNNFEYVGNEVTIKFNYKSFLHEGPLSVDYNSAILNKKHYCRPLRLTTVIKKNETGEKIDSEALGPIYIPELSPRGFIIDGHGYDVVNLFREAYGWYITIDKEKNLIMSMKTRVGGKFIIVNKNNQLFIEHNGKSMGFGVFLKAITEMDSTELLNIVGTSNELIRNTIEGQLYSKGYEMNVSECILEAVILTSSGKKTKESLGNVPDSVLRDTLTKNISKIDIGNEGVERYKKFITFQRRAEGAVLIDDVVLTSGEVIKDFIKYFKIYNI